MKKIVVVIICVLLLNILLSCSNEPTGIRDEFYNAGLEAMNIADKFLDMEIIAYEVFIKGTDLINKLDAASGFSKFDNLSKKENLIMSLIFDLTLDSYFISESSTQEESYEKIFGTRNELAGLLGQETRDE